MPPRPVVVPFNLRGKEPLNKRPQEEVKAKPPSEGSDSYGDDFEVDYI